MKEVGLPNWAKTPDLNSKDQKQNPGTTNPIIEEETQVKKEPFSKRRDSNESANRKARRDSAETKQQKVETAKTPQTPVKATSATPKKTSLPKEKNVEKSPLKTPPSPSKVAAPRDTFSNNILKKHFTKIHFKCTLKKYTIQNHTFQKSALKSPPSPSKAAAAPGSPSKQRRGLVRSESAQVPCFLSH